jgi:putative ATP-binding cassette transporter
MKRIIAVNRNLNFFTTGYNYMIQLIPALFVAPLFIQGNVDFGVIGQSAMAFATLLGAFSIIITQFQSISAYGSVITRLAEFVDGAEAATARGAIPSLVSPGVSDRITYARVTLRSGDEAGRILVKDLEATIQAGKRVLVCGTNNAAKQVLFRATAGLYSEGAGEITCPPAGQVAFLAQRPYVPPVSLRELLAPVGGKTLEDAEIHGVLREVGMEETASKSESLDFARKWHDVLSLREQQLMAVARLLVSEARFAFLDRLESALPDETLKTMLQKMTDHGITWVAFGKGPAQPGWHDASLELHDDGTWSWTDLAIPNPS